MRRHDCDIQWCVNRGTEKFTGANSTNREKGTHTQHLSMHNTLWSVFELASKEQRELLSVSVFAHACCADIHMHAVHMLLSETDDPNDLLFTFTKLNTDDIQQQSSSLVICWSTSGIRLSGKYNECVHVILHCLLACSLFFFDSSTMGRLCSLESVWMVFEF